MAHDVEFSVPPRSLGRADIEFIVKRDGVTFGTLRVSKGSLVWFPRDTVNGHKIGWSRFDRLMRENVHSIEKR